MTHSERGHTQRWGIHGVGEGTNTERGHTRKGTYRKRGLHGEGATWKKYYWKRLYGRRTTRKRGLHRKGITRRMEKGYTEKRHVPDTYTYAETCTETYKEKE